MIFKSMYLNKNLINLKQILCGRGFPGDSDNEESACNTGDLVCSWVRKIPWRREWLPSPEFLPGEFMDKGTWWGTVHGISKSQTQLSN